MKFCRLLGGLLYKRFLETPILGFATGVGRYKRNAGNTGIFLDIARICEALVVRCLPALVAPAESIKAK